jgi:two-component system, NarL family, invasion response regulator UvrY
MKILIVDDHAIVRRGLKQILEGEIDPVIVGEAQNAQEALQKTNNEIWDMIILDINLPDRNGLDLLSEFHFKYPKLPIMIMSMYSEDQFALRAFKTGAVGYLNKQSAPEELVKAIKKIASGGKYVSEIMAELLASNVDKQEEDKPLQEILSDREYQVFLLLAAGKTVSEISNNLSLSVKTVSTYRARLLEKMNLKNNAELIYFAAHHHLADLNN